MNAGDWVLLVVGCMIIYFALVGIVEAAERMWYKRRFKRKN